jgi:hypothetical protein
LISDLIKKSIDEFLRGLNLLSLGEGMWNQFEIKHTTVEPTPTELRDIRNSLKDRFPRESSGIYVYQNINKVVLYAGKAKSLYARVYSHYQEAYRQVPGDKTGVWHYFFKKYSGNLIVYWVEIENERERHIIEQCLELILETKFDKEFPKGKRVLPQNTSSV